VLLYNMQPMGVLKMKTAQPLHLSHTRVIIGPTLAATEKAVTPAFYAELGAEFGDFAGHSLLSQHRFTEAWATWERHPAGDECVYLLSGDIDMVLWDEAGERVVRLREPGTFVIIPRGVWHTARPHQTSELLFLTPGEGTQNVEWPPERAR
jgi:mannose-6-phosphate isomerase-like protein (cupin superfamily)